MSSRTNFSWPFVDPPPAPRRPKRPWESSPGTSRAEAARDWQRRVRLHAQREAEAAAAAAAAAVWAAAEADETVSVCEPLGAAEERPAAETVSLGEQLEAAGLTAEEVASVLEQLTADEFANLMPMATGVEVPSSEVPSSAWAPPEADGVYLHQILPHRGSLKRSRTGSCVKSPWSWPPPSPRRLPLSPLEASNRILCEVAMEMASTVAGSNAVPHRPQTLEPVRYRQFTPPSVWCSSPYDTIWCSTPLPTAELVATTRSNSNKRPEEVAPAKAPFIGPIHEVAPAKARSRYMQKVHGNAKPRVKWSAVHSLQTPTSGMYS